MNQYMRSSSQAQNSSYPLTAQVFKPLKPKILEMSTIHSQQQQTHTKFSDPANNSVDCLSNLPSERHDCSLTTSKSVERYQKFLMKIKNK